MLSKPNVQRDPDVLYDEFCERKRQELFKAYHELESDLDTFLKVDLGSKFVAAARLALHHRIGSPLREMLANVVTGLKQVEQRFESAHTALFKNRDVVVAERAYQMADFAMKNLRFFTAPMFWDFATEISEFYN